MFLPPLHVVSPCRVTETLYVLLLQYNFGRSVRVRIFVADLSFIALNDEKRPSCLRDWQHGRRTWLQGVALGLHFRLIVLAISVFFRV
jgi:hypothetical protein